MEIKNIHKHAGWYASYEKSEQGKALIECQAKKINQLTELLEKISGDIELTEQPVECDAQTILDSIKKLIDQTGEIEYSVGFFKWIG